MSFKKYDVITFAEGDKVVVIEALLHNGNEYLFVNEILEDESDLTDKYKVLKVNYDNGTLVKEVDVNVLQEILPKMKNFHEYLLDSDISPFISIILDGNLKAASDKNLIFVYKNERTSNLFNENLINIEKTIEKVLKKQYKVIATDIEHWEQIKNEFNNKKRQYNYIEETFNIEDLFNETKTGDFSDFQDIIVYK